MMNSPTRLDLQLIIIAMLLSVEIQVAVFTNPDASQS
jgi:hypothetical protein